MFHRLSLWTLCMFHRLSLWTLMYKFDFKQDFELSRVIVLNIVSGPSKRIQWSRSWTTGGATQHAWLLRGAVESRPVGHWTADGNQQVRVTERHVLRRRATHRWHRRGRGEQGRSRRHRIADGQQPRRIAERHVVWRPASHRRHRHRGGEQGRPGRNRSADGQ